MPSIRDIRDKVRIVNIALCINLATLTDKEKWCKQESEEVACDLHLGECEKRNCIVEEMNYTVHRG